MNLAPAIFKTPFSELVKKRRSWRNYTKTPVEDEKINRLNAFMVSPGMAPFGSVARFQLIKDRLEGKKTVPGTYGVIKGAEHFIAGIVKKSEKDMEDFGYLFEKIILLATDMDLATCWMGGTFSHSSFAKKIGLMPDETLPAVSPVGYPAKGRAFMDAVIFLSAGSKSRKPWQDMFFDTGFGNPLSETEAGQYRLPLDMVRLAPSACNRQPWRIIRDNRAFHFFLERTRTFDNLFKADLQRIDMGIAMCHFELAAMESGLKGKWETTGVSIGPLPDRAEYVASWIS